MKTKVYLLSLCLVMSQLVKSQAPQGYYNNAANKVCGNLKQSLSSIIAQGNKPQSYAALWQQYTISDLKPRTVGSGSANVIYDIYSCRFGQQKDPYQYTPTQQQCGTYNSEADCYNREHSVPKSWFNGDEGTAGPATDYIHIFPSDGYVNGRRSNYIYGEVATANYTSLNGSKLGSSSIAGFTGNVFEPVDSMKGDLARAFLYFVTRYENNMASYSGNTEGSQAFGYNSFPSVKVPYLKLMLKWHQLDPVSQKEVERNNAAYGFQGNRNPYVDSPQYVNLVWNSSCPGLSALPIDELSLEGKFNNNIICLKWETTTATDVEKYIVQRSVNGTYFENIYETNNQQTSYNDAVNNYLGTRIYYRVIAVKTNGSKLYSQVFTMHIPNHALQAPYKIYPNPTSHYLNIVTNTNAQKATLVIADINGKIKMQANKSIVGNEIKQNIQHLPAGTYIAKIIVDNAEPKSLLFVVK